MPDFFSELVRLVSPFISGQQQPPLAGPASPGMAPAAGAPGGAAPPPSGGLAGLLNSPVGEGALTAYLSYLAAPRGNQWRRLGFAGLGGLQGFQEAETAQAALPGIQARTREELATAQLKEEEAAAKKGHPEYWKPEWMGKADATLAANQRLHSTVLSMAQDTARTPQERALLNDYATFVAGDSAKEHGFDELDKVLRNPLELEHLRAQTAQERASAAHSSAETAAIPQRLGMEGARLGMERERTTASTALANERRKYLGGAGKPLTENEMRTRATAYANGKVGKVPAAGTFERFTGTRAAQQAEWDAVYNSAMSDMRADRARTLSGVAAGGADDSSTDAEEDFARRHGL